MIRNIALFIFSMVYVGFAAIAQEQSQEKHQIVEEKKEAFIVYGNCGMCERTIEGSVKNVEGVSFADWDKETDKMTIMFNPNIISIDSIKQKIADVGYDSNTHRAKDEVYKNLPDCCQYERPFNKK